MLLQIESLSSVLPGFVRGLVKSIQELKLNMELLKKGHDMNSKQLFRVDTTKRSVPRCSLLNYESNCLPLFS